MHIQWDLLVKDRWTVGTIGYYVKRKKSQNAVKVEMSVGSCDQTSVNELVTISWDKCAGNELLVPSLSNSMEKDNLRLTISHGCYDGLQFLLI